MDINNLSDELLTTSESFQKEFFEFSDTITKIRPNTDHEDSFHLWIYIKLAEFETRLQKLENK